MSTRDKTIEWFERLPEETREKIDELFDKGRLQEEESENSERTLRSIVKDIARVLEELIDDSSQISRIIKQLANGRISDNTIEKALPSEKKRKHKQYERYQDKETNAIDFQRPVTLATNGSAHMDGNPNEEDGSESYTKADGSEGERAQTDQQGPSSSYRIVMDAGYFKMLVTHMQKKFNDGGSKTNYAIEHDADTQALFVDVAEETEEVNVR